MDEKLKEIVATFHFPPKMVYNDRGEAVEVILSYEIPALVPPEKSPKSIFLQLD